MNKLKIEAATIASDEQPQKILVIMEGIGGVDYHRLAMPFAYIKERIKIDFAIHKEEIQKAEVEKYDIVIFSRYLTDMSIVHRCKNAGVKIIVDIDDYWNVPKYNPAYKTYNAQGKKSVIECMHLADMIWTTTPQLAATIYPFNNNVHILPNYIDTTEPQWNERNDHPLTIGYVGGFSHLEDVKLLRGQMEAICKKHDARFLLCGYNHIDPLSFEMEYQITGSKTRPDWFWVAASTSIMKYGVYYSHIDIAIAPLTQTHFNKHKSELKIVEAAAYKLPIVVSEVEPYTNHKENRGVTFVKNNDWSVISEVIENRKQMGKWNHEYCQKHHNIDDINNKRIRLIYGLQN